MSNNKIRLTLESFIEKDLVQVIDTKHKGRVTRIDGDTIWVKIFALQKNILSQKMK